MAIVSIIASGPVRAEVSLTQATEEPADTILTSVVFAAPGPAIYSALGHAALRMQAPKYGLDYVFSYESEDANSRVLEFLAGKLNMKVMAIPASKYLQYYSADNRKVVEYNIQLPDSIARKLWQQMDERIQRQPVKYEYLDRGCALATIHWLMNAIKPDTLEFAPWPDYIRESRKEISLSHIPDDWHRFLLSAPIAGDALRTDYPETRKATVPSRMAEVLAGARYNGVPLTDGIPHTLADGQMARKPYPITPMMMAVALLVLAVANIWLRWRWVRITYTAVASVFGLFLCYLTFFSTLPYMDHNWLAIPFCPLPIILWHWRRWWAAPMALIEIIWIAAMLIVPTHMYDDAYLVIAAALAVIYAEIAYSSYIQRKRPGNKQLRTKNNK